MDGAWAAEIGERMKAARDAAGLSRQEVAEAIGRSEGMIAGYEQGKRAPFKEIREIAGIINADLPQLLHGDSYIGPLIAINTRLRRVEALLTTVPGVSAPPEMPAELGRFDAAAQPNGQKAPSRKPQGAEGSR
jgi:transcriptional regulator with XRE-family HTH domain